MKKSRQRISGFFSSPITRVVIIYMILAAVWIFLSDQLIALWTQDAEQLTWLQSLKGIVFIIVTAGILYTLMTAEVKKLEVQVQEKLRISEDLRTSNERLAAIIEASPLSIVVLDPQMKVKLWNPAAERLFGWSEKEVLDRPLPYVPPSLLETTINSQRRVWAGKTIMDVEVTRVTKSGRPVDVLVSSAPLHNRRGEIDQILGVIVDVTARKQAEHQLAQLSKDLEQRVRERTADLEKANHSLTEEIAERLRIENELREQTHQLAAINAELETFSYSVSHDLRAPLRQIGSYSQLLMEEAGAGLSAQAREDLRHVQRATTLMSQLIDALLQLSRVSRGKLEEIEVDLAIMARETFDGLRRQDLRRDVSLVAPEHLVIDADPRLMRSLLENLLNNAWKFTRNTPDARIELGADRSPGRPTVYYVRDNGVGFEKSNAEKMFSPFQRFHSSDEYPGLGIGLATVQRIVHRYGGEIWAEGEINHGATFYFTLNRMAREG